VIEREVCSSVNYKFSWFGDNDLSHGKVTESNFDAAAAETDQVQATVCSFNAGAFFGYWVYYVVFLSACLHLNFDLSTYQKLMQLLIELIIKRKSEKNRTISLLALC